MPLLKEDLRQMESRFEQANKREDDNKRFEEQREDDNKRFQQLFWFMVLFILLYNFLLLIAMTSSFSIAGVNISFWFIGFFMPLCNSLLFIAISYLIK